MASEQLLHPEQREVPQTINIVLIGYRATGKSTIARRLAEALGRQVISTDAEVERREGRTIKEMVGSKPKPDWDYFRDRESEVCREVSLMQGVVIDTGGGAILREENRRLLKRNAVIFLLTASNETMVARIGQNESRPSLTGTKSPVDEVAETMQERGPLYKEMADHEIRTDVLSIEDSVEAVISALKHH